MSPSSAVGHQQGSTKLEAVKRLVDKLQEDLHNPQLSNKERDALLEELKIYGRDPVNAEPIFTKESIAMLTEFAYNTPSETTSQNALRCLANSMLLVPRARQHFVDLGYESKACDRLKCDTWDDEFLAGRVLLLSTYIPIPNNSKLVKTFVDDCHIADHIILRLGNHADVAAKHDEEALANPMQAMALTEITRLLYNLTYLYHESSAAFTGAIPHLLVLLCSHAIPMPSPLEAPMGPFVNALLNLPLEDEKLQLSFFPEGHPDSVAERLTELLERSLAHYPDHELEATVSPLVAVIGRVYARAPEATAQLMQKKLLPTEEDRKEVLGRGHSIAAKLLNNLSNPLAPTLRKVVADLLLALSNNDPSKLVDNIGYGFASGILFDKKMPVPEDLGRGPTAESGPSRTRAFNPITGQFVASEKPVDEPEMTEEEKEREAERLFVLFERLKQTGIVDVQNPVEQAFREGRFADIDDKDRVEELD